MRGNLLPLNRAGNSSILKREKEPLYSSSHSYFSLTKLSKHIIDFSTHELFYHLFSLSKLTFMVYTCGSWKGISVYFGLVVLWICLLELKALAESLTCCLFQFLLASCVSLVAFFVTIFESYN